MSSISTHILDAALGRPVANVSVQLWQFSQGQSLLLAEKHTDADGRIKHFTEQALSVGAYQLVFLIADYFSSAQRECFYPKVSIDFSVLEASQHYHVPLLISPFSYSTYRGS